MPYTKPNQIERMDRTSHAMRNCSDLLEPHMYVVAADVAYNIGAAEQTDPKLYINLMVEEQKEFLEAVSVVSVQDHMTAEQAEQIIDGALDLIWVTVGFLLLLGVDVPSAWAEIARSNHAKVLEDGTMLRNEHGKFLKPEGWTPPNLANSIGGIDPKALRGFAFKDVATAALQAHILHGIAEETAMRG